MYKSIPKKINKLHKIEEKEVFNQLKDMWYHHFLFWQVAIRYHNNWENIWSNLHLKFQRPTLANSSVIIISKILHLT
jgi:hypothetical protein